MVNVWGIYGDYHVDVGFLCNIPPGNLAVARENGLVSFPTENCDFPQFLVDLPEGSSG